MKKKFLIALLASFVVFGCDLNNKDANNASNQNIENNNNNQPTGPVEQTELEQEYVKTVSFSNADFASTFNDGTNFNAGSGTKNDQLKEFLDNQLEYINLITSIELDYCTARKYDGVSYFQLSTGKNAKNEGYFKWNSGEKIYKIEVTALNYANPYTDYSTSTLVPNVEGTADLKIDGSSNSLTTTNGEFPTPTTFTKEYNNGVNSFTLAATGGRVLIKEIKITWRG